MFAAPETFNRFFERRNLLIACALVAATHLLFLLAVPPAPIHADADFYDFTARRIMDGLGFTADVSYRAAEPVTSYMPGYPLILAGIYTVFGRHPWAVRVLQTIAFAFAVGMVSLTARRLFSARVGALSFALLALFPAWFIYPGTLLSETALLAVQAVWFWQTYRAIPPEWSDGQCMRWAAISGAIGGVLTMIKPEFFLWVPLPAIVLYEQSRSLRRALPALAAAIVAFTLVLAPWIARNEREFHRFIPLTLKTGTSLWMAAHDPVITEFQDPIFIEGSKHCFSTDPKEGDQCLTREGIGFIRQHPGKFVRSSLSRLLHTIVGAHAEYLTGFEESFGEARAKRHFGVLAVKGSMLAIDVAFFGVGLLGLAWVSWSRRMGSFAYMVATKLLVCAVLFATPRYGLHLTAIVAMTAAALCYMGERFGSAGN